MRRALVIGGSVGGLFAALLLRQRGWAVTICERSIVPLAGRGAGIVTHPQLWDRLQEAGVTGSRDDGVKVAERVAFGADGSVLGRFPYEQVMTSWDRLFGMLRAIWGNGDYRLGHELRGIEQTDHDVTAIFADGTRIDADLLVAADGVRSTVRALCLAGSTPVYAGYVGWRGMVAEADIPPEAHRDLFGIFAVCVPDGEQFIGYPVPGDDNDLRQGHRRTNFVWYRPADESTRLPELLTDINGRRHLLAIPPPLIRPHFVEELRDDARQLLAPQIQALITATSAPFLQPIFDLDVPAMGFGRVALLGDAAFVVRPHVGAGVTKAAEDAQALAESLDAMGDVGEAVVAYSNRRVPAGRALVRRARDLGAYMEPDRRDAETVGAPHRHSSPLAVMAETASLAFQIEQ